MDFKLCTLVNINMKMTPFARQFSGGKAKTSFGFAAEATFVVYQYLLLAFGIIKISHVYLKEMFLHHTPESRIIRHQYIGTFLAWHIQWT